MAPFVTYASGDRKRNEDQRENGANEDETDDVDPPEEVDGKTFVTSFRFLERFDTDELALALSTAAGNEQTGDRRNRDDWKDDGKHADSPSPCAVEKHRGGDIPTDPCVDLEKERN